MKDIERNIIKIGNILRRFELTSVLTSIKISLTFESTFLSYLSSL